MGYRALALKIMANAAIGIGLVKLWREKTGQNVRVIDGEVDEDEPVVVTTTAQH